MFRLHDMNPGADPIYGANVDTILMDIHAKGYYVIELSSAD